MSNVKSPPVEFRKRRRENQTSPAGKVYVRMDLSIRISKNLPIYKGFSKPLNLKWQLAELQERKLELLTLKRNLIFNNSWLRFLHHFTRKSQSIKTLVLKLFKLVFEIDVKFVNLKFGTFNR